MKKKIMKKVLVLLVMLSSFASAIAQVAIKNTLKIGDTVPDLVFTNLINADRGEIKISDYRGKLLILDFWATWCGACIHSLPKADSLQKVYRDKLAFLPISYEKRSVVESFLQKFEKNSGIRVCSVAEDKVLNSMFPHSTLPHYVWLDSRGIVIAITESFSTSEIQKVLIGEGSQLAVKEDVEVPYTYKKGLFEDGNGGAGNVPQYKSTFVPGYLKGVANGRYAYKDTVNRVYRVVGINTAIRNLFMLSYSDQAYITSNMVRLEVADPDKIITNLQGAACLDWLSKNAYTYELMVPVDNMAEAYPMMRADLARYFPQYTASYEKRMAPAICLVRTWPQDFLKSKGGTSSSRFGPFGFQLVNFPLRRICEELNTTYLAKLKKPILDETGYKGWVDMNVEADLSSLESLNKALSTYGLKMVEKEVEQNMLVIRDSKL